MISKTEKLVKKRGYYSGTVRPTFVCIDPDCKGGIEYLSQGGGTLSPRGYFSCRFCYAVHEIRPSLVKKYDLKTSDDGKGWVHYNYAKKKYGQYSFEFKTLKEVFEKKKEIEIIYKKDKNKSKPNYVSFFWGKVDVYTEERTTRRYSTRRYFMNDKIIKNPILVQKITYLKDNSVSLEFDNVDGTETKYGETEYYTYKNGILNEWRNGKSRTSLDKTKYKLPNKKPKRSHYFLSCSPNAKTVCDNLLTLKQKLTENKCPIPHSTMIFQKLLPEQIKIKSKYYKNLKTPCCNSEFTKLSFNVRLGYYQKPIPYAVCDKCNKLYEFKIDKEKEVLFN